VTADPYSELVRKHFENPRHCGDLPGATAVLVEQQGMRVRLAMLAEDGKISKLRFRVWGCPHLIAGAEEFCAKFEGKPVSALQKFAAAEVMQSLAVPVEKTGRILVLEDAIRALEQKAG
jgi:NifU-like protein involved in Fe-S cluster formation